MLLWGGGGGGGGGNKRNRANLLGRGPGADRVCRRLQDLQRAVVQARKAGAVPDVLLLCEHAPVITLGRNGKSQHLRVGNHVLGQMQVAFHATRPRGRRHLSRPRSDRRLSHSGFERAPPRRALVCRATGRDHDSRDCPRSVFSGKRLRGRARRLGRYARAGEEKLAAIGVHISAAGSPLTALLITFPPTCAIST